MEQLETEIKLRLPSHDDYNKLLDHLGTMDGEVEQLNVFFDSHDGQLAKAGWALRVRTENKRGLVTLKGLTQTTGIASVRREIEEEIDFSKAIDIIESKDDIIVLSALSIEPIAHIKEILPDIVLNKNVSFENLRCRKKYIMGEKTYTLEIDRTRFSDGSEDYELEVELENLTEVEAVESCLRDLLVSLDIPLQRQPLSKLVRALDRKK